MKKYLPILALCSLGFIYSCDNQSGNDSMDRAEERNEERDIPSKDADFVTTAAARGMFEVEAGKLASQQATHADVKSFAQRMVNDHSAANNELQQLANSLNIAIPQSLSDDRREKLNDLREKQGYDFDKEYMEMMVSDHKDSVGNFEDAAEDAESADLKNWAAQKVSVLREHHQMAEQLKDKVKDMK
jgi:putative membrane protein